MFVISFWTKTEHQGDVGDKRKERKCIFFKLRVSALVCSVIFKIKQQKQKVE